jgi:hypothetical protein
LRRLWDHWLITHVPLPIASNGPDLALGIFQHVFDIGHISLFRDFGGCVRPGAKRYRPFIILIPRL